MDRELTTQITRFVMDGYAHQILANQIAIMTALTPHYHDDSVQTLRVRTDETRTLLAKLSQKLKTKKPENGVT